MRKIPIVFILSLLMLVVTGCSDEHYTPIDPHQSFVASMNILEPSLSFYNQSAQEIATWSFEKAYTGATLVGYDNVLLYGHQLTEARLYELSSGKLLATLPTGVGVTNAYYDEESEKIFITNSKTNDLSSYTMMGKPLQNVKLGNYPMSMIAYEGKLYVVNYKDTVLSIVSTNHLQKLDEWEIPSSSHGLLISANAKEMWIGGHGEGIQPNDKVHVYDLITGQRKSDIVTPLMPIGFAQHDGEVAIASHGSNMIYRTQLDGTVISQQELAANPFAVAYFNNQMIVAGYDDQVIYFMNGQQIQHQVKTGKGPFQLLVREE